MVHKVYARSSLWPRSDLTACRPMYRHRSKHYHNDILDRLQFARIAPKKHIIFIRNTQLENNIELRIRNT